MRRDRAKDTEGEASIKLRYCLFEKFEVRLNVLQEGEWKAREEEYL